MSTSPSSFQLDVQRGVAHITLDRPDRLNALTFEVYRELADTFYTLSEREDVRAITLTGRGRGFCSGGDVEGIIAELFAKDARGLLHFTRATARLIQSICEVQQPVIAAVNGVCVGAGAVIAAACDLRVAATKARFGFIFPKVGLSGADMGASWLLPRIVGMGNAAELLLFGDLVSAEHAHRIGFVNHLADTPEATVTVAREWAERLAGGPAFAHTITKRMLRSESTMQLADALEAEAQAQAICMAHPDFRIAHDAYNTKTKPRFVGAEVTEK